MNVVVFAVLCFCACGIFAAVWQEKKNPLAGEGECLSFSYPEMGVLEYGEIRSVPNKCVSVQCNEGGHVTGTGCLKIGVPEGCILEDTDYTKPHPECCPKNFQC